jgi:SAM-dependent methyltransferase
MTGWRQRLFWSVYARLYDHLWDTPHLREVCAEIDALLPAHAAVLEVGAGTGIVAGHLIGAGRRVVGCEPSAPMAMRFAKRLPAVALIRADLTDLPSGSAANVVAVNLVHLLDDPPAALARLLEVCTAGGQVIVVTPDPGAGVWEVAEAQRRRGVHPLRVLRFALWHVLLAPLSMASGMPAQVRLDWFSALNTFDAGLVEVRTIGDVYRVMVLPGLGQRTDRIL